MAQTKQAPGWGKAVGILMIIFGALGVFIQIYKLIIPSILKMQGRMMDRIGQIESYDQSNPFNQSRNVFDELIGISDAQANVLIFGGILGFIGCVFYILGGVKLLNAQPKNYNFAKIALLSFLTLNTLTMIFLIVSGNSMLITVILIYIGLGFTIDLVLAIVLLSSDKRAYGIGGTIDNSTNTVYTRDEEIV